MSAQQSHSMRHFSIRFSAHRKTLQCFFAGSEIFIWLMLCAHQAGGSSRNFGLFLLSWVLCSVLSGAYRLQLSAFSPQLIQKKVVVFVLSWSIGVWASLPDVAEPLLKFIPGKTELLFLAATCLNTAVWQKLLRLGHARNLLTTHSIWITRTPDLLPVMAKGERRTRFPLCNGALPEQSLRTILACIDAGGVDQLVWHKMTPQWEKSPLLLQKALEKRVAIRHGVNLDDIALKKTAMLKFNQPLEWEWHHPAPVPAEWIAKKSTDLVMATLGLILFCPFFPLVVLWIKTTSPGPVFFRQERIGKRGKPFCMYKFRSMYIDAEQNGPALSKDQDERVTTAGKFLRKWRIDEIPQFVNLFKGEMSLVGPRPERAHYIAQIQNELPCFDYYYTVTPGITSLGMVQFGYAHTAQEMIERFEYDQYYIQNRSIWLDFKIIGKTFRTLLLGKGK